MDKELYCSQLTFFFTRDYDRSKSGNTVEEWV